MRATVLLALVVGCATTLPDSASPPDVCAHAYEVPRIPYPAYIPDGVQITRLDGDSAWTRGGLVVNDVVESVNGKWTPDPDAFREAVGTGAPRRVRILASRAGPVGQYRIVTIEVAS